ncbi:MAG TPA: RlmE family RNA methyltransferase [Thiobacillus sp.]
MVQKAKRTKSGGAWMHEHVNDPHVKKAQTDGYRSRAAYKLLEIDKRDRLLRPGLTVVDLGAAPGSWCQVAAQKVGRQGRVLAIDLLPLASLPGVESLEGDFAEPVAWAWLEEKLQSSQVDLVLSDMAPNISGVILRDQARHYELCELALEFAVNWLKPDGAFLVKAFQGVGFEDFRAQMRQAFEQVLIRKPDASRDRSTEVYLLGRGLASTHKPGDEARSDNPAVSGLE